MSNPTGLTGNSPMDEELSELKRKSEMGDAAATQLYIKLLEGVANISEGGVSGILKIVSVDEIKELYLGLNKELSRRRLLLTYDDIETAFYCSMSLPCECIEKGNPNCQECKGGGKDLEEGWTEYFCDDCYGPKETCKTCEGSGIGACNDSHPDDYYAELDALGATYDNFESWELDRAIEFINKATTKDLGARIFIDPFWSEGQWFGLIASRPIFLVENKAELVKDKPVEDKSEPHPAELDVEEAHA